MRGTVHKKCSITFELNDSEFCTEEQRGNSKKVTLLQKMLKFTVAFFIFFFIKVEFKKHLTKIYKKNIYK